ncbi:MAG TPA: GH25 family lysozyme [Phnomibacter sp.]|nr:GH25 family lysozyme [Phnomibacter sp.]
MAAKKRNPFFTFSVVILLFIGSLLAWFFWRQIADSIQRFAYVEEDNTFTRYPGFGIWMPDNYSVHGIDVSRYQQRVNWSMVRKMKDGDISIRFAFIKATEGSDLLDRQFARNWKKARQHNVIRGAYHFFTDESSGHEQAMYFIKNVELLPGDLPPVLDIERYTGNDPEDFVHNIDVWLKVIEEHYGVKPIIYSNAAFYNTYLEDAFEGYPLWVAHYQNKKQPSVQREWQFWQHNEQGRINGINAFVDFNVFNGSEASFQKMLVP